MVKRRRSKWFWGILISVCLIFILLVIGIFHVQQQKLHQTFDDLVADSLLSYTHGQRRQVHGIIMDASNTLSGIASLIEDTDLSPDGDWLELYLSELSAIDASYQVDYLSTSRFMEIYNISGDDNPMLPENLTPGKAVISDIYYSEKLDGKYVFAIAVPVIDEGETCGILRTRINVDLFTQFTQQTAMFNNVRTVIINTDGDILYSNTALEYKNINTENLYSAMVSGNISPDVPEEIQTKLQTEEMAAVVFSGNGNDYFMTGYNIGYNRNWPDGQAGQGFPGKSSTNYNDWYIVNFVRSPDILIHSNVILKSVVYSGLVLIGLTAVIGAFIIFLLLRQKHRLDLEQQRYLALSQFTDTVLFEYDCEKDLLIFTPNAQNTLKLDSLALKHFGDAKTHDQLVHPDDWSAVEQMLTPVSDQPEDENKIYAAENRLKSKDGQYNWYSCQYRYIKDRSGRIVKVIGKLANINSHRTREQELLEKTQKDVLTDTYNKSGEEVIQKLLKQHPAGMLFMMDMDNFKEINDTYGHTAGDLLLQSTGQLLNHIFRSGDVVARLGGDEFAVFIPQITSIDVARKKARLILLKLGRMTIPELADVKITASIGIAIAPKHGTSFEQLYMSADKAMYTAKNKYKHQGGFYISK